MGSPKELLELMFEGDKDAVVKYMDRHKMTPKYFLDYNKNLMNEKKFPDLYYPVAEAAKEGELDIMNTLIERGFDPENKDVSVWDNAWGPLQWACCRGHLHIVESLIEDHNVNVNSIFLEYENIPLSIAFGGNDTEIAKYLIEKGAVLNNYVVGECVRSCDPEMIEYILSKGVDVNAKSFDQSTLLFQTVTSEDPYSSALVLLDAGADVNAKDQEGNTTFLRAAKLQDVKLMRLLISRGADPNVVNDDGNTALHFAVYGFSHVYTFDYGVIKYLVVELGLECLSARNSRETTPVSIALMKGCDKIFFELLVNYGCSITDEFDRLSAGNKEFVELGIRNCKEYFQQLKQCTAQPRSLQDLASLKLRCHLGVHLESAVMELPLPEILKDLVRIKIKDENDDDYYDYYDDNEDEDDYSDDDDVDEDDDEAGEEEEEEEQDEDDCVLQ